MMGRLTFNLLLLVGAVYFVWSATDFDRQARQIPLLIGVMVLVLQAWVTFKAVTAGDALAAEETSEEPPPLDEARKVAAVCGWMGLYFVLFALIGTLPATFLFILAFLLMQPDVRWWIALAVSIATSGAIWLLFVRLMRFELYPGVLFGGTLPPL
jgi:hypothetical protein